MSLTNFCLSVGKLAMKFASVPEICDWLAGVDTQTVLGVLTFKTVLNGSESELELEVF